jgi:hypothetical protein
MNYQRIAIPAIAVLLFAGADHAARADDAKVTIVAIMASANHQDVDPKLQQIAAEVKKHEQSLTGFKILNSQFKSVNVGQKEKFDLINDQSADVTVVAKHEGNKRIRLTVKPPTVGEITYSICYDKFFPIVTRYMSANERLIIAIMVQPPKDKEAPK